MQEQKNIIVTGSSSGMGKASKELLQEFGANVIGISQVAGEEIQADLSSQEGVKQAIEQIIHLTGGKVDGVFANAGMDNENAELVFGLNYFGIIQLLEGLKPYLSKNKNGRVLINSSNSVVVTPEIPLEPVEALLAMDKAKAMKLMSKYPHWTYQVSKTAITFWARKAASSWAESGISMNILAPGAVLTPLIENDLKDPRKAAGINMLPKPLGSIPKPEDIAPLVKFLLLDNSKFIVGQYIIIDGGTEATWKSADFPKTWDISLDDFRKKLS
ncbi:SDR family oxidoreductase [Algoriphagus formosus]|uniref:SDR family oxidoreductase n=1 Tax=Algoriphagus formosus TaxID=2007308 RepID=UPI000C292BB9|nr:SDR family oxidoreductase [Algoriphagus formosus]